MNAYCPRLAAVTEQGSVRCGRRAAAFRCGSAGWPTAFGQDIHFSQFTMTPLNLNPAQAGAEYDMRVIVNYKNQWGTVAAPYSTANIAYDMKLGKNNHKKSFMVPNLILKRVR